MSDDPVPHAAEIPPHQQRVIAEKRELDDKIDKLKSFIGESPIFENLPDGERQRLNHQYDVMLEYSSVLAARIGSF